LSLTATAQADPERNGKVQQVRHAESYFLSGSECLLAALLQLEHPNLTSHAEGGSCGSKFVTVCVSGDANGDITLEAYQVSAQFMSLVDAGCVDKSRKPSRLLALPSVPSHPRPDVQFSTKDKYGNEVIHRAWPTFPVEYALVTLPATAPTHPNAMFSPKASFPVSGRGSVDGNAQVDALRRLVHDSGNADQFRSFHLLLTLSRLGLDPKEMSPLFDFVRTGDHSSLEQWLQSPSWTTVRMLVNNG
jgi:nuclear protein localization protein 4 homolog